MTKQLTVPRVVVLKITIICMDTFWIAFEWFCFQKSNYHYLHIWIVHSVCMTSLSHWHVPEANIYECSMLQTPDSCGQLWKENADTAPWDQPVNDVQEKNKEMVSPLERRAAPQLSGSHPLSQWNPSVSHKTFIPCVVRHCSWGNKMRLLLFSDKEPLIW